MDVDIAMRISTSMYNKTRSLQINIHADTILVFRMVKVVILFISTTLHASCI